MNLSSRRKEAQTGSSDQSLLTSAATVRGPNVRSELEVVAPHEPGRADLLVGLDVSAARPYRGSGVQGTKQWLGEFRGFQAQENSHPGSDPRLQPVQNCSGAL